MPSMNMMLKQSLSQCLIALLRMMIFLLKGLAKNIYRSDHPGDTKIGVVCLYYRDELPIKRRTDLELLQEMIVSEISLSRKKIIFATLYRSSSQDSEQFESFSDSLQRFFYRSQE